MQQIIHSRVFRFTGLILGLLVWLANSSNPPNGRTGAPFDGHCNGCHGGNNPNGYDGTVTISGLPSTIESNTTYQLTLNMDVTAGNPSRAGYQLVIVDGNNANAGNLTAINTQSGTEFSGGREYIEQRGAKSFSGGNASWDFEWTSPSSAAGNTIRLYYIGNFCNGSGSSGDRPINFSSSYDFAGNPPVSAAISTTNNVSCFGGNDGSATVTPAGGVPPYTYLWSNGQTGETAVNLTAGNYTVTVTGSGGSGTATASTTITQPPQINVSATVSGIITCNQPVVSASATASGGQGSFQFAWSDGQNGNQVFFDAPGNYEVTATDANGCTRTTTVAVSANTTPPAAVAQNQDNLSCIEPEVMLSGIGSSSGPAFSYQWSTSDGNILSGFNTLFPVVNEAGTYTLTVANNNNGCTAQASTQVTADLDPPLLTVIGDTLDCLTDTVQINLESSVSAAYAWTGPNGFTSSLEDPRVVVAGAYTVTATGDDNGCTANIGITIVSDTLRPAVTATGTALNCLILSDTITAVSDSLAFYAWSGPGGFVDSVANTVVGMPGAYIVTVTSERNGCSSVDTAMVTQNIVPPVAGAETQEEITCAVSEINLDGTSSSQGNQFVYLWSTADGNIVSGENTLTPLVNAPGAYTLAVTNLNNGCVSDTSVLVLQDPPVSLVVDTILPVSCNGLSDGVASVAGLGGDQNYTFEWSTGDTTATAANLAAGMYFVTLTDGNTCTDTLSVSIVQPTVLLANASATGESALGANDGSASANPTGGTTPYLYLWVNGANTPTIQNLSPGNYSVTVSDANNCTAVQTVTVNAFNCSLSGSVSVQNVSCNGLSDGTAAVQIIGAANPVTILWSTGDTTLSVTGLSAGVYSVSITDANNCPLEFSATVSQPAGLLANASATDETALGANDGTATANPTGGTAPYQFLWSNGATTQTITGLAPGIYSLTVTDANDCSVVRTVAVNAFDCSLSGNTSILPVSCFGLFDGQVTVVMTAGSSPFAYLWSNGATTPTASNLGAGNYVLTVTDANDCVTTFSVEVPQPDSLTVSITTTPATCPEDNNGSAAYLVSGGTAPYGFSLPQGSNFAPGNYSLTITDANACLVNANFSILSADTQAPSLSCPADIPDACEANSVIFGTPEVTDNCSAAGIALTQVQGFPSGSVFPVGETVQVFSASDASGNSATCSFTVTVSDVPEVVVDQISNDVGNSGSGAISISILGNAQGLEYLWLGPNNFVSAQQDLTGLFAGLYTLSITDTQTGCVITQGPFIVDNLVSSAEPFRNEKASLSVRPNPAVRELSVTLENFDPVEATLLDAFGQIRMRLQPAMLSRPVDVGRLEPGVYFLIVLGKDGQVLSEKWVKATF